MGQPYTGDPAFGERQFVDSKPWMPPRYQPATETGDPFWKDPRTFADVAREEAEATPSGVFRSNAEPGVSEYTWGRGLMAPLALGPDPTAVETMKAIQRTNPADPNADHRDRYADWIRES